MTSPVSTDSTPTGTINVAEDVFIEGGPDLWFGGVLKYDPDDNNYYWGITGTPATPAFQIGCYQNFQLSDDLTVNEVRCDTVGVKQDITRRNFLEATFDLQALLPLSELRHLLRLSSALAVPGDNVEYVGIGEVNQQDIHLVYFSRVYDPDTGDWVSVTGTRCQFRWTGPLQLRYGEPWMVGVTVRFYANEDLPTDQRFATMVRYDPSVF